MFLNLLSRLAPSLASAGDLLNTIQYYPYHVDWSILLKLVLSCFVFFWLPGFLLSSILFQDDFDYLEKTALSFPISATLAVLSGFIFKFSGLSFAALTYALVFSSFFLLLFIVSGLVKGWPKIKFHKLKKKSYVVFGLMLALLFFAVDFALRSVGSYSFLLGGDTPTYYFLTTQALKAGPFADNLPFFKDFIPNWFNSGFAYLLAILKMSSGVSLLSVFRYFPVLVQAPVLLFFFVLIRALTKNSIVAFLSTLFLLGFSRGPEGNEVPILILPLAWAMGWSLFATSLLLFVKSVQLDRIDYCVYGGLISGANSLIHLLDVYRLVIVLIVFLVLLFLVRQRLPKREFVFFTVFSFAAFFVFSLWAAPLYLKYGYWEQASWEWIRARYGSQLGEIVEMRSPLSLYVPPLSKLGKIFADNIGPLATLFLPIGFYYLIKEKLEEKWLLIAWFFSLFLLTRFPVLDLLERPYRHYEYIFLAGLAISAMGIHGVAFSASKLLREERARRFVVSFLLGVFILWHGATFTLPRYVSYVRYPYPVPIPRDAVYEGPVWRDWFAAHVKGEPRAVLNVGLGFDFVALSEQHAVAESKFLGLRLPLLWQKWSDYDKLTSLKTPEPEIKRLLDKHDVSYIAIKKDQPRLIERFKKIIGPVKIYEVGSAVVFETRRALEKGN